MSALVTVDDIRAAKKRLLPFVRRTSVDESPALSAAAGTAVSLKMESWQVAGSWKPRIVFNKLLSVDDAMMKRGAVAATAGNHGIAVAYAARALHLPAELFIAASVDPAKLRTLLKLLPPSGKVHRQESMEAARQAARAFAEAHARPLVAAGEDDAAAVAAGGTVGLEIVEDVPDVDLVVAPAGALARGIAVAVAAHHPRAEIWPVGDQPAAALDDAVRRLYRDQRLVIEPSGAAAVAAILAADVRRFHRVVAVLSSRNVGNDRFAAIIKGGR